MSAPNDARALLSWRPRLTIRSRLTLSYAGLVTGCGVVLIAVVWVFMRFVPSYSIVATTSGHPEAVGTATPAPAATGDGGPSVDPERIASLSETFRVASAADFLQLLLLVSVAALVVLALLSALVGWIVAGRVLRPLTAINDAAMLAATGSLDHRVGLQGPHDEIRSLSDTFDGMLGSLGRSFDAHRRFAANASHELRTPIATVQTMIDVTLADPDADAATLRSLAGRIRTVNSTNLQTVESLLDLAEIGQIRLSREPVDLTTIVGEAVRSSGPEADAQGIEVLVHPPIAADAPVTVSGDPVLLRQCIGNLVQNGVRHNHRGGSVEVRVAEERDSVVVAVANTGDPVPDLVIETLSEPFVRGAGRTSGGQGHGLGLAIAASVADAHGGTVRLSANLGGGLVAEVVLPRA